MRFKRAKNKEISLPSQPMRPDRRLILKYSIASDPKSAWFAPKCEATSHFSTENAAGMRSKCEAMRSVSFFSSFFLLSIYQYYTEVVGLSFVLLFIKIRRYYGYNLMGDFQAPQETRRDVQSQDQSVSQWDDDVYADTYFHLWYLYPILFFRIAVL